MWLEEMVQEVDMQALLSPADNFPTVLLSGQLASGEK